MSSTKLFTVRFELKDNLVTYVKILETINGEGRRNKSGGKFCMSTLQTILGNRKTYEGYYHYGKDGEWVKGQQEAILSSRNNK